MKTEKASTSTGRTGIGGGRTIRVTDDSSRFSGTDNGIMGGGRIVSVPGTIAFDFDTCEKSGRELGDAIASPSVRAFKEGAEGRGSELPDSEVEGKEESDRRGGDVNEESGA